MPIIADMVFYYLLINFTLQELHANQRLLSKHDGDWARA
jgi:hypothetical protein